MCNSHQLPTLSQLQACNRHQRPTLLHLQARNSHKLPTLSHLQACNSMAPAWHQQHPAVKLPKGSQLVLSLQHQHLLPASRHSPPAVLLQQQQALLLSSLAPVKSLAHLLSPAFQALALPSRLKQHLALFQDLQQVQQPVSVTACHSINELIVHTQGLGSHSSVGWQHGQVQPDFVAVRHKQANTQQDVSLTASHFPDSFSRVFAAGLARTPGASSRRTGYKAKGPLRTPAGTPMSAFSSVSTQR